ncbi:hypothetical protein [Actinomadura harenae]|uniref:Uncharacterized protein n=1 Tax=Actinomadura harenae TaxID=2483351 RepID=A0A3M2MFE7_9ACTN|nr:hypothetical protein [Actinomadura harenae]RMI45968.1 hypothetical protein EBO15_08670 [Actinomadura harenae]
MPDSPVPPSRWGDSPPWWLTADTLDAEPPPSGPSREDAPPRAAGHAPGGDASGRGDRASAPADRAPTPLAPAPRAPRPGGAASTRRSQRKIVLVSAVGGLCAIAAVAAGTFLMGGGDGGPAKQITVQPEAGGLRLNAAEPAASVAFPFITEAVRRGGASRPHQTSAVYSGAASNVLFIGGTASITDPIAFLDRARPNTALSFQHVGPGVCGTFAVLSEVHPYCAWATSGSYGFVASNLPAQDTTDLAKLTTRLRGDVER